MRKIYRNIIMLISLLFMMSVLSYADEFINPELLENRLQTQLDSLYQLYDFPGATAACILADGSLHSFAVGFADVESRIPMQSDSRMLAASIGKTFVGATVLALVAEGKLQLDKNISFWLGSKKWFNKLPNNESITLRQLLTHSSGIPNHVEMDTFRLTYQNKPHTRENPFSPEELIEFVLDQEALFPAGTGWHYSDTGYILVGLIIQEVTGNSYYEEVSRRFLEPRQLSQTSPSNQLHLPGLASGYMNLENPFNMPPKTTSAPEVMAWHPGLEWTGGGMISNSSDLARWAKMLYEGNVITGDYLPELLRAVPIGKENPKKKYGIAVTITETEQYGKTFGHMGWIPGYCSNMTYYPDYEIALAYQINTDIGIVDGSTELFQEMGNRLIDVILNSKLVEEK